MTYSAQMELPMTPARAPAGHNIREMLENCDLMLVLDSPNGDYRFEYSASPAKDRETGTTVLIRKYRLLDLVRGTITAEPWDAYNIDAQARILTNLIGLSLYRLKVIAGWYVKCQSCGHAMNWKIWKLPPKRCTAKTSPRCRSKIEGHMIEEILFECRQ